MVTIEFMEKYKIDVFTTHAVAEYNPKDDEYRAHRLSNCLEYITSVHNYVMNSTHHSDLLILTGDLNNTFHSEEVKLLIHTLGITDTFEFIHSHSNISTHVFDNKRLDYILFKIFSANWEMTDSHLCYFDQSINIEKNSTKELAGNVKHKKFYSDHLGVFANFQLVNLPVHANNHFPLNSKNFILQKIDESLEKSITHIFENAITTSRHKLKIYFVISLLAFGLAVVSLFLPNHVLYGLNILLFLILALVSIIFFLYAKLFKWVELKELRRHLKEFLTEHTINK